MPRAKKPKGMPTKTPKPGRKASPPSTLPADPPPPVTERDSRRLQLRAEVRRMYDWQKLRIQTDMRTKGDVTDPHVAHLTVQGMILGQLERQTLTEIKRLLELEKIAEWLQGIKGIGPILAAVIISEIDIHKAHTPSNIWSYCGLATDRETGKAIRRKRGEKCNYNPWIKSKLIKVAGDCLIKSKSPDYYPVYLDRKRYRESQKLAVCMACEGTGKYKGPPPEELEHETELEGLEHEQEKPRKDGLCSNCEGRGKDAPWGRGKMHRSNDAIRFMIKRFLEHLYNAWRPIENLTVHPTYAEAKLGRHHGDHAPNG